MALYNTIKISTDEYSDKPIHIFTDSLNSLYLINTQIKHPSLHVNHPNKTISIEIITMPQQRTHPTTLYKVRAHANISGNKIADDLAKAGHNKQHFYQLFHMNMHIHTTLPPQR